MALLLSAPAEHNSAAAHEALSGHVQEEDTSTSDTTPAVDVSSSGSMLSAAEDVDAAGLEQTGSTVAAGGASKASILHDMLITIHAEQEVSGQVYLAFATQLVRAGADRVLSAAPAASCSFFCFEQAAFKTSCQGLHARHL